VIYEPQTFMEYDIVIVQVQYRLGALGMIIMIMTLLNLKFIHNSFIRFPFFGY